MITKISMNQVASYKEPTALETSAPINLIYGLNGSGKTTISNYLSDRENEVFADCAIEHDDSSDFVLRVYNQVFIDEAFFNQDIQKGIFTLSKINKKVEQSIASESNQKSQIEEAGKSLNSNLEEKQQKIDQLTTKTQNSCFKIKQDHTGGDRIFDEADFLKGYKTKALLLKKLFEMDKVDGCRSVDEIKKDVERLSKSSDEDVAGLSLIEGNSALQEIESNPIFAEVIVGSSNSSLSKLIDHLGNSDWFSQGLTYLETSEDQCPFCQQKIKDELKGEITTYLNESYKIKTKKIGDLESGYEQVVSSIPEWSSYESCEFIDDHARLKDDFDAITTLLKSNQKDIAAKGQTPSRIIALTKTEEKISNFNKLIGEINNKIKTHNQKVKDKGAALAKLKEEFWLNQRNQYDAVISTYTEALNSLQKERGALEKQITEKRAEYTKITNSIQELQKGTVNIDETISNINSLLLDCGLTGFNIVKEDERYYRIAREGEGGGEKVFSTLSEGEKTMISFFYFLELCRGKADIGETQQKIIVIDDPISSLSHMYVFNIAQLIKREFTNANPVKGDKRKWELENKSKYQQCFVLTHSLYFFFELADMKHDRRKAMQSLYRVTKGVKGSQIVPMSYSEIQNDYQSYWSIVRDKDSHPALLANSMRNIIEYFFGFIEKKELSNIFPPDLNDIKYEAFNRYINRESHSPAQNIFDIKEFDYEIFKEAFRLVFEKAGYIAHYQKMIK